MIITEELIRAGVSERGGWNRKQTILLGAGWPLFPGWKSRVIGKEISDSDAALFLSLKGQTLKKSATKGNKLKSDLPFPVEIPTDSACVADSFWVWLNRQPRTIREQLQESLVYMARKNGQAITQKARRPRRTRSPESPHMKNAPSKPTRPANKKASGGRSEPTCYAKLPAHRFTHEKYCGTLGYQPLAAWDYTNDRPQKGFFCVGWCDAKALSFRPRDTGRAIMLYEEPREEKILFSGGLTRMVGGEEFWIHA